MVISINTEKNIRFNFSFMIKTVNELGRKGVFLTIIEVIYHKQPISYQGEYSHKYLCPQIWNKIRMSTSATTIQYITERFNKSNQGRERNKGHQNQKRGSQITQSCRANDADAVQQKSSTLHQKAVRIHQTIQQSFMLQNNVTKNRLLDTNVKLTGKSRNPICNSSTKIKIFTN